MIISIKTDKNDGVLLFISTGLKFRRILYFVTILVKRRILLVLHCKKIICRFSKLVLVNWDFKNFLSKGNGKIQVTESFT